MSKIPLCPRCFLPVTMHWTEGAIYKGKQMSCGVTLRNFYLKNLDNIIVHKPGENQPRKAGRI